MRTLADPPRLAAVIRLCRPRQWVKNLLVLAAPLAAGILWQPAVAWRVALLFVLLGAVSSGGYIVNDIKDVQYDREHPDKRNRPIANGEVSMAAAALLAGALTVAGVVVAAMVFGAAVCIGVLGYIALSWSYSLGVKRVAGLEMLVVASGFVARAVVGGLGTGTRLSTWFLLFIGVAALFVVVGKRLSEMERVERLGVNLGEDRLALRRYTIRYLRAVASLSAAVAIGSYVTWVLSRGMNEDQPLVLALSAVPLAASFVRYIALIVRGKTEAPEDALLRDPWIVTSALMWFALFALSVNAGA